MSYIIVAISLLAVIIIGWFAMPRLCKSWHTFEQPDRALAYFALFLALALLLQQMAGYRHSITYWLSPIEIRNNIDINPVSFEIFGNWGNIMIGCYWIFLVVAILFAVALVRGTIVDIKNSKNDDKLDAIKKSIDDLVAEIRLDRKERKDRENYDG